MHTRRTFLRSSTASALAAYYALRGGLLRAQESTPDVTPYLTPYKYGKLVLAKSDDAKAFDSKSVDCPFVFHHEGKFYMTYVGYDGIGYQTGLASSDDLIHWTRLGCILRRDPSSPITRYNIAMNWILREKDLSGKGNLLRVNGEFLGAWHAYPEAGYESGPAVIGLCRSKDLMHWELGAPILRADDADAAPWEQGGLYKPCLVREGDSYYLFYNAKTRPNPKAHGGAWREQTGVATSKDLRQWTRYKGNPIISNGPERSWDDRFASDPCVLRHGKEWAFFYYGLSSDGKARDLLALGSDPFHPRKVQRILVDAGPPGTVDDDYAHKPSVVAANGILYHFYCAVSGKWPNDVRGISVARSKPWS